MSFVWRCGERCARWSRTVGVRMMQVMSDVTTGESKGYGFVKFTSREERDRYVGGSFFSGGLLIGSSPCLFVTPPQPTLTHGKRLCAPPSVVVVRLGEWISVPHAAPAPVCVSAG